MNQCLRLAGTPRIAVGPGEIAIDPHIHTMFSRCSISRPDKILLWAARLGLAGVGVMDHNVPRGLREVELCANDFKRRGLISEDFIVITGAEINSRRGHIGALFVRDTLPENEDPAETVRRIHEAGGLAVAVHPYHSTGIGDALFDIPVDAVESHCGSVFDLDQSLKNARLAHDSRLQACAMLGSSDAHYLQAIGTCCSVFKVDEPTPEGVRSALVSRQVRAVQSRQYVKAQRFLNRVPKLK